MNVSRSNRHNIKIDLDMSHDSYLFDDNGGGYLKLKTFKMSY